MPYGPGISETFRAFSEATRAANIGFQSRDIASGGGRLMYYTGSPFVSSTQGQTGSGLSLSGVLGGVLGGLQSVFHFPSPTDVAIPNDPVPTQQPVPGQASRPPMKPGGSMRGPATAAGAGAAIGLGIEGVQALMGHKARYAAAGTKGYHMIKRGPHAGLWTRNRHRNVANIRALRRALSRAHGFERICKKVYHFAHRRPGGSGFKRTKRRR